MSTDDFRPVPKPPVEERSEDLLSFVRNLPCGVCSIRFVPGRPIPSHGSHPHHVHSSRTHGDLNNVVPLCLLHHTGDDGVHTLGRETFANQFRVDLETIARGVTEDWLTLRANPTDPAVERLPW